MGQITKTDNPKHLLAGLKTIFHNEFNAALKNTKYNQVATEVESTKSEEDYAWLGQSPRPREFGAERIPKGLSEFSFTIKNKKYEASIRVDREDLEDEQYGQIRIRVEDMARNVPLFYEKQVVELLSDSKSKTCYDGQFMVDTDHSEGDSGTQSNKSTVALSASEFGVNVGKVMKFKDDRGEIIGLQPNVLMVPVELRQTAREILNSEFISDGTTTVQNVWRNSAELVESPFLKDANDWFLLVTNQGVRPVILQHRTRPDFTALENDSESGFMQDANHYGIRLRANVGYGDWRKIWGAIVA